MTESFKKNVQRLLELLSQSPEDIHPGTLKVNILDFSSTKRESRSRMISHQAKVIQSLSQDLFGLSSLPENVKTITEIQTAAASLDISNPESCTTNLRHILLLCDTIIDTTVPAIRHKLPALPDAIRGDVAADLEEIQHCLNAGCFRSATILCGRILETALHRKYYETTGVDILEKNPGIGLGNLIAKLVEQHMAFDPGLTQQIHLINQVRVFSVHKKQEAFYPSKAQAEAIVLYTIDSLDKLFPKKK